VPNIEIRYVGPNNEPLMKGNMVVTAGNLIPSAGDVVQIDGDIWIVHSREIAIQGGTTKTITIRCQKPSQS